jgi:hypothetical protein
MVCFTFDSSFSSAFLSSCACFSSLDVEDVEEDDDLVVLPDVLPDDPLVLLDVLLVVLPDVLLVVLSDVLLVVLPDVPDVVGSSVDVVVAYACGCPAMMTDNTSAATTTHFKYLLVL